LGGGSASAVVFGFIDFPGLLIAGDFFGDLTFLEGVEF
jgi:hypothetical protein